MSGGIEVLAMMGIAMMAEMAAAHKECEAGAVMTRANASEEERQRRLEEARTPYILELRDVYLQLQQPDALYPAQAARLRQQSDAILAALQQARTERELAQAAKPTPQLLYELHQALTHKSRHDQQGANQEETARLRGQSEALTRGLTGLASAETADFDKSGRATVQTALAGAQAALGAGDKALAATRIAEAEQALSRHAQSVALERAAWREQRAEAQQAVTEFHALVAGLRADSIVMRWRERAVAALEEEARQASHSDRPTALLAEAKARAETLIQEAYAAQFKANQRDYIAQSIARSLAEMGFVVGAPEAEHPDHPATAKVLQAASAAGKSVAVSVPLEGQVWYEVDGFIQKTETTLGGGTAVACDEAESMLTEMHARLDSEFQVEMGEIWWQGKDPDRRLRRADELPGGGSQARRDSAQ